MTRLRLALVALLTLTAMTACGSVTEVTGGPGPGPGYVEDKARMRLLAQEGLDRWDQAVAAAGGRQGFAPVGELTAQIGQWEPSVADNNKAALMAGFLDLSGVDGLATIRAGLVAWPDGSSRTVRTTTVDEAVAQLRSRNVAACGRCTQLRVTAVRPTTVEIETTRGVATAPAWEFSFAATAVRVTQVAVARAEGIQLTPPPWDAVNPPPGLSIERAVVEPGGNRLTVSFIGARNGADVPCGIDYTAEAVESANAVVVILHSRHHDATEQCLMVGFSRQTTVDLVARLDDRAVLEAREGRPVPVTVAR